MSYPTLPLSALKQNDDGHTVAYCEACGTDTLFCKDNHLRDEYSCLVCSCGRIDGLIPLHGFESGCGFRVNPGNGVGVMFVHYTADPDKNPDTERGRQWLRRERRLFSGQPGKWNKLYEIDFQGPSGPRIFPEFDETLSFRPDLRFDPTRPLMAQFDFGTCAPAVSFAQWDRDGNYNILLEVLGFDPHIEHWFTWVNRFLKVEFFGPWGLEGREASREAVADLHERGMLYSYGDLVGGNQRDRFKVSDIQFAKQFGWSIKGVVGRSPIRKIEKVRSLTCVREDGKPRLFLKAKAFKLVRGDMPVRMEEREKGTLFGGFLGGYHWREDNKGVLIRPLQPDKTGSGEIFTHLIDTVLEGVENTYDFDLGVMKQLAHPDVVRNDFYSPPTEDEQERNYEEAAQLAIWTHRPQDLIDTPDELGEQQCHL